MKKSELTIVLNHQRIALIIERMAHELYEQHHARPALVLMGVEGRGHTVAQRILGHLSKISDQELSLQKVSLDKLDPTTHPVQLSCEREALSEQTVILVDDVLNSGKTLVHALSYILQVPVHSVTTVVLVDRIHRRFPVRADIVGMTLSTTIQERVEVELGEEDFAYLV